MAHTDQDIPSRLAAIERLERMAIDTCADDGPMVLALRQEAGEIALQLRLNLPRAEAKNPSPEGYGQAAATATATGLVRRWEDGIVQHELPRWADQAAATMRTLAAKTGSTNA